MLHFPPADLLTPTQHLFRDKSGTINQSELNEALASFGYNLSPPIMKLLIERFDRTNSNAVSFDDFIQCCLALQVNTQSIIDNY